MSSRSHLAVALGITSILSGCSANPEATPDTNTRPQNAIGFNAIGFNAIGFNAIGFNAIGFNAIGFNSINWDGIGWTGTGFANPSITPDWGLDPWVNDTSISLADQQARITGISYWTGCACNAGDHLKWVGHDPSTGLLTTMYFDGLLGLAPTWCHGTTAVPPSELEAVSACLYARINTKGIHNALSIRGYENTLKLADNEKLFMAYPEGQYWGSLYDPAQSFKDVSTGLWYANSRANACYFADQPATSLLMKDLGVIVGRTCEFDGCGGGMHTTLQCFADGNTDGAKSQAYYDPALTSPAALTADPITTSSGPSNSPSNGYQDWLTGTKFAVHYNKPRRRVSVFLGAWADLETGNWKPSWYQCDPSCGGTADSDGCKCYDDYCSSGPQGGLTCEKPSSCNNCQTIVRHPGAGCWGTDALCKVGDCVRNRKLTGLAPGCWLPIQFTRPHDLLTGTPVAGNANMHKAGTLIFRYSHVGPGPAGVLLQDQIRGVPIPVPPFAPTGNTDVYANQTLYPIYPGRTVFTGALPGIEISLSADPTRAFPELDYAQIHVGPPYGQTAREMYWSDSSAYFKVGQTVCQSVVVTNDTDFTQAGLVRFRPEITGANINLLNISLSHNGVAVPYVANPTDSPWSEWIPTFQNDSPTAGTWDICVNNAGDTGTFVRVDFEMKQL